MAEPNGGDWLVKKLRYSPIGSKKFSRRPSNDVIKVLSDTKKKKELCGSLLKLLGLMVLITLFAIGVAGSIIMWATDILDNFVLEQLVLRNNTQMFEWWQTPPVQAYMKVRIFNYTNVDQIIAGLEKPRLQEVGPYTFRQTMNKVHVVFNDNGTVTYRENVGYEFVPEMSLSKGEDDIIVVPNVPLLSAISLMKDSGYLKQFGIAAAINSLNSKTFLKMSASEFMWGYKEALTSLARVFTSFGIEAENLKLGILERRGGMSSTVVTVETGATNLSLLGIISRVDGRDSLDAWGDTSCSQVDGSDGSLFPPQLVRERRRVYLFNKDLCRKMPLEFHEEIEIKGGIPAYRYKPPKNIFYYGEDNRENDCFCGGGNMMDCSVEGIFSVAPCAFGAPVFISFPHFYLGSNESSSYVDGLKPEESKHAMYLDLHPVLGVPMGGQSRLQFNAKIRKSSLVSHLDMFEEGAILPSMWLEMGVDELPPEVRNVFYSATFTMRSLELGLMYGFLALTIIMGLILLRLAYRHFVPRRHAGGLGADSHIMEPL